MPVNEGLTITITARCGTAEYTEVVGVGRDGRTGLKLTDKQLRWFGQVVCSVGSRADAQRTGPIDTKSRGDYHTQVGLWLHSFDHKTGTSPGGLETPPSEPSGMGYWP